MATLVEYYHTLLSSAKELNNIESMRALYQYIFYMFAVNKVSDMTAGEIIPYLYEAVCGRHSWNQGDFTPFCQEWLMSRISSDECVRIHNGSLFDCKIPSKKMYDRIIGYFDNQSPLHVDSDQNVIRQIQLYQNKYIILLKRIEDAVPEDSELVMIDITDENCRIFTIAKHIRRFILNGDVVMYSTGYSMTSFFNLATLKYEEHPGIHFPYLGIRKKDNERIFLFEKDGRIFSSLIDTSYNCISTREICSYEPNRFIYRFMNNAIYFYDVNSRSKDFRDSIQYLIINESIATTNDENYDINELYRGYLWDRIIVENVQYGWSTAHYTFEMLGSSERSIQIHELLKVPKKISISYLQETIAKLYEYEIMKKKGMDRAQKRLDKVIACIGCCETNIEDIVDALLHCSEHRMLPVVKTVYNRKAKRTIDLCEEPIRTGCFEIDMSSGNIVRNTLKKHYPWDYCDQGERWTGGPVPSESFGIVSANTDIPYIYKISFDKINYLKAHLYIVYEIIRIFGLGKIEHKNLYIEDENTFVSLEDIEDGIKHWIQKKKIELPYSYLQDIASDNGWIMAPTRIVDFVYEIPTLFIHLTTKMRSYRLNNNCIALSETMIDDDNLTASIEYLPETEEIYLTKSDLDYIGHGDTLFIGKTASSLDRELYLVAGSVTNLKSELMKLSQKGWNTYTETSYFSVELNSVALEVPSIINNYFQKPVHDIQLVADDEYNDNYISIYFMETNCTDKKDTIKIPADKFEKYFSEFDHLLFTVIREDKIELNSLENLSKEYS